MAPGARKRRGQASLDPPAEIKLVYNDAIGGRKRPLRNSSVSVIAIAVFPRLLGNK